MAIRESFFELLERKPIEKISVTEICNGADINRGTFYSHYSDPYDLRRSLCEELNESMRNRMKELGTSTLTATETMRLCRENKDLCRIFAGENGDMEALNAIISSQSDTYLQKYFGYAEELSETQRKYLKLLLVSSITVVFKQWLDNGLEEAPEEVAKILEVYAAHGIKGFIGGI